MSKTEQEAQAEPQSQAGTSLSPALLTVSGGRKETDRERTKKSRASNVAYARLQGAASRWTMVRGPSEHAGE